MSCFGCPSATATGLDCGSTGSDVCVEFPVNSINGCWGVGIAAG